MSLEWRFVYMPREEDTGVTARASAWATEVPETNRFEPIQSEAPKKLKLVSAKVTELLTTATCCVGPPISDDEGEDDGDLAIEGGSGSNGSAASEASTPVDCMHVAEQTLGDDMVVEDFWDDHVSVSTPYTGNMIDCFDEETL